MFHLIKQSNTFCYTQNLQKLIHFPWELRGKAYIFGKGIKNADKWDADQLLNLNIKNFDFLG